MTVQVSYVLRIVAIVLLIGCLAKMPYGYFQLVRISTTIIFLALAYAAYTKHKMLPAIMCTGFAILLNPIIKVHFVRSTWNAIDVALAGYIVLWLALDFFRNNNRNSGKP